MKVVRLSALRTGRRYPQEIFLSQHQEHSAARMIMSMKNSNVTIGNRTHSASTNYATACPKSYSSDSKY